MIVGINRLLWLIFFFFVNVCMRSILLISSTCTNHLIWLSENKGHTPSYKQHILLDKFNFRTWFAVRFFLCLCFIWNVRKKCKMGRNMFLLFLFRMATDICVCCLSSFILIRNYQWWICKRHEHSHLNDFSW